MGLIAEKRRIAISAIEDLLEDHKLIMQMVGLIDISVEKAEKGAPPSAGVMSSELEFCRDFVSKWHETKEEQVLMPALSKIGYPSDRGPIWQTIEDHRKGRSIIRRWAAAEKTTKEDQKLKDFLEYASAYSMYLYEHIKEEERGLYRAAQLAIPPEMQEDISKSSIAMDKELSEEGGRERYSKIIDRLKKELG